MVKYQLQSSKLLICWKHCRSSQVLLLLLLILFSSPSLPPPPPPPPHPLLSFAYSSFPFIANSRTVIANAKRNEGESVVLDLWREKFDKSSTKTPVEAELAKWVAVGKDAVEKKVDGWEGEGVEWEEVDGDGKRQKGKKKNKGGVPEEVRVEVAAQQPSKALYTCGVELDYKFFSENWKIFNELTSPSYKLRNALPVEPQSDENLYQTSETV